MQQFPQNGEQMPATPTTIDFDPEDRSIMGSTGIVCIVSGSAMGLMGLLNLPTFTNTLSGLLAIVVAAFLILGGIAIRCLGQPSPADYQNLMTAFRRLRVAYILQGVAIIVALVGLALAFLYFFVVGSSGIFR